MDGSCGYWILFVDLDGTLWDHRDVSSLLPPFRKLDETSITDLRGVVVKLNIDVLRLVSWAKRNGALVSTLSWNLPEKALAALEEFGLKKLFDYHVIEPHPMKGDAALKFLEKLRREKGCIPPPCAIVYIDDRDIHLANVRERLGPIVFLQAWKDFTSFEEARRMIVKRIKHCIGVG